MIKLGILNVSSKTVSSVTSVTGLTFAPVAVVFFAPRNLATASSGSTGSTAYGLNFGVLTGAGQFAFSSDSSAGSTINRRHASGICVERLGSSGGGTFSGALTADGFDLTCTDATGTNQFIHWIAFGGDGVSATSGLFTAPASPSEVDHALGLKPDLFLAWSGTTLNNSSHPFDHCSMSVVGQDLSQGCWSGKNEAGSGGGRARYCVFGEAIGHLASDDTLQARGIATALTSNGIRINWTAANSQIFHYLAIKGVPARLQALAASASLNGDVALSGLPWQPDAGMLLGSADPAFNTPGTANFALGSAGGQRRYSIGFWERGGPQYGFSSITFWNSPFNSHQVNGGPDQIGSYDAGVFNEEDRYALQSVQADGYTVRTVEAGTATSRSFLALAMHGTPDADANNAPFFGAM